MEDREGRRVHQLRHHQNPPQFHPPGNHQEADCTHHEGRKIQRTKIDAPRQLRHPLEHRDLDQHTDRPHPADRALAVAMALEVDRIKRVERGMGERVEGAGNQEGTRRRPFQRLAHRRASRRQFNAMRPAHRRRGEHHQQQHAADHMRHECHRQGVEQISHAQHRENEPDRAPDPDSAVVARRVAHMVKRDRLDQRHLRAGEKMHRKQHQKQPCERAAQVDPGEGEKRQNGRRTQHLVRFPAAIGDVTPYVGAENAHHLRDRVQDADLRGGHADVLQVQSEIGGVSPDVREIREVVA